MFIRLWIQTCLENGRNSASGEFSPPNRDIREKRLIGERAGGRRFCRLGLFTTATEECAAGPRDPSAPPLWLIAAARNNPVRSYRPLNAPRSTDYPCLYGVH